MNLRYVYFFCKEGFFFVFVFDLNFWLIIIIDYLKVKVKIIIIELFFEEIEEILNLCFINLGVVYMEIILFILKG